MATLIGGYVNPLYFTPALWLDFSDASRIFNATSGGSTPSNGTGIGRVEDKSGNGLHFTQATSNNRPAFMTAIQNGLSAAQFDGSNDELIIGSNNLLRNINGATLYTVRKWGNNPTSARAIFRIANNAGLARLQLVGGASSGKSRVGGRALDADGFISVDSSANVSTSAFEVQSALLDYANTDLFQYINNSLDGTTTSFQTATTTSNTAAQSAQVGSASGTSYFDGLIGEILLYHSSHNAETRARITSYLRNKWGF